MRVRKMPNLMQCLDRIDREGINKERKKVEMDQPKKKNNKNLIIGGAIAIVLFIFGAIANPISRNDI